MSQKIINFRIELDKPNATYAIGEIIKGKIHVETTQVIDIETLVVKIEGAWRGKFTTKHKVQSEKRLVAAQTWQSKQSYTYDFELAAPETFSYRGHNLEIAWGITVEVQLTEAQRKKVGIKKGWFASKAKPILHQKAIQITRGNVGYEVHLERGNLVTPGIGCGILFMIPFLLVGYITFYENFVAFLIVGILFSVVATAMILYFILTIIFYTGIAISAKKSAEDDEIAIRIHLNGRESRLNNCTFGYDITEQVEDNRGTSKTTVTKKMHTYTHPERPRFMMRDATAMFPMPTEDFPPSGVYNGQGYTWKIWINKKVLGFIPLESGILMEVKLK